MRWDSKYAYEVPGKLEIPYRYFAGKTGSEFLTTLRDQKKILASKCESCGGVMVPPRSLCDKCHQPSEGLTPVGPGGVITALTVVRYQDAHLPMKPPYILANIKLDGADTGLTHIVVCPDLKSVKIGTRVEPVWSEDRKARITDISYFRPVDSGLTDALKDKAGSAAKAVDKAAHAAVKKVEEVIRDSEPAARAAKKKVADAVKDGEKMARNAVKAVEGAARTVEKKVRQAVTKAKSAAKAKPAAKKAAPKPAAPKKAKPAKPAKKAVKPAKKAAPKKAVAKKPAAKKAALKKPVKKVVKPAKTKKAAPKKSMKKAAVKNLKALKKPTAKKPTPKKAVKKAAKKKKR